MVKTPAGYKVGKRSKRAVFDLRDMLIAVEDAEDEALHTEKSKFKSIVIVIGPKNRQNLQNWRIQNFRRIQSFWQIPSFWRIQN